MNPSGFDTLRSWAADLERRQAERRQMEHATPWKPAATSASMLGWECERRIVYHRVEPWAAEPPGRVLSSIFEEGHYHESQVVAEAQIDLKVKVCNRNATFRDSRYDLSGQVDMEVWVDDVGWVPAEIKGLTHIPGESDDADDLSDGAPLHRRYFAQLMTYLILRAREMGLFIFKSKSTGLWRCIPVALDYDRAEQILRKAERVRDAVRDYVARFEQWRPFTQDGPSSDSPVVKIAGSPTEEERAKFKKEIEACGPAIVTAGHQLLHVANDWDEAMHAAESALPPRIADRSECARCPFLRHCNPSQAPVDPALLIDDEFLVNKIRSHESADPARREYARVHKELHGRFEMTAGSVFFAGPYRIEKRAHGKSFVLKITNQEERDASAVDNT